MLDKFSEMIRGNLSKMERFKLVALVTIEVLANAKVILFSYIRNILITHVCMYIRMNANFTHTCIYMYICTYMNEHLLTHVCIYIRMWCT